MHLSPWHDLPEDKGRVKPHQSEHTHFSFSKKKKLQEHLKPKYGTRIFAP